MIPRIRVGCSNTGFGGMTRPLVCHCCGKAIKKELRKGKKDAYCRKCQVRLMKGKG